MVRTQDELDAAIKRGEKRIEIDSDPATVLEVRAPKGVGITIKGSSKVVARDSSNVYARDSSNVRAYDSSKVVAFGSSQVVAFDSSKVQAYDSSKVVDFRRPSVEDALKELHALEEQLR